MGNFLQGPLQLINDGDGPLRLAIPLRGTAPRGGRYRIYDGAAFRYVAHSVPADGSATEAQLAAYVEALQSAGLEPDGRWRLVFGGEAGEQFELQLGVRETGP